MKPTREPPIPLSGEARAFWDRHYRRLVRRKILTAGDVDSFAVLSITWAKLVAISGTVPGADQYREMIQFINLNKQYQSLAKQFALLPRERKSAKMDGETGAKKDQFGL